MCPSHLLIAVPDRLSTELLMFDRMALALDVWSALLLGILYLAFQAFPIIFQGIHGFNIQSTGLAFIGMGVGVVAALSTQPYWNGYDQFLHPHFVHPTRSDLSRRSRLHREAEKHGGNPPPEIHLLIAQPGAIIAPIGTSLPLPLLAAS